MTTDKRDIVEHSIEAFVKEVVSLTLDGWAISKTCPGDAIGYGQTYTVSMYRDENTVDALRQIGSSITEKPKMTRAEILQKARASRKPKLETEVVE